MNPTDSPSNQNQNFNSSATATQAPGGSSGASSIRETVGKVREAATTTAAKAKDKVAEIAGEGKNAAAERVLSCSDQLRDAQHSAERAEDPNIAHFAGQAADRLEQVADYLRDADFGRLRQDATDVARRHPALFLGGMFVAGLVLGNLAKASVQSLSDAGSEDDRNAPDDHGESPRREEFDGFAAQGGTDDDIVTAGAGVENRNAEP